MPAIESAYLAVFGIFETMWYAVRRVLRPIGAPIERLVYRVTAPAARRGAAEDLALADQLAAAGMSESAERLRQAVGERQAMRR